MLWHFWWSHSLKVNHFCSTIAPLKAHLMSQRWQSSTAYLIQSVTCDNDLIVTGSHNNMGFPPWDAVHLWRVEAASCFLWTQDLLGRQTSHCSQFHPFIDSIRATKIIKLNYRDLSCLKITIITTAICCCGAKVLCAYLVF